jgi:hypothetical protein
VSTVLRKDTGVTVRIGPFVDYLDAVTPETGITFGSADEFELLKANGVSEGAISGTPAAVTGAPGWYDLALTAGETDTVGDLTIVIQDADVFLPVWARFQVVEEAVYDVIYASGATALATAANVTAVETDTQDLQTQVGAAGAGLTAVPWNAAWDAEAQSECADALTAYGAATAANVSAVETDTQDLQTQIGTAGAGLTGVPWNAAWDSEVESEVNDALDTAIAELSQGKPTATPTLRTAVMLLYMALRNRTDVTTTGTDYLKVFNDSDVVIAKKQLTDDGTDFSEAEMETGP